MALFTFGISQRRHFHFYITFIVIAADLDLVSILPLDGVDGDGDVGDGGDVPVVSLLHPTQTNINQPVKINQYWYLFFDQCRAVNPHSFFADSDTSAYSFVKITYI